MAGRKTKNEYYKLDDLSEDKSILSYVKKCTWIDINIWMYMLTTLVLLYII